MYYSSVIRVILRSIHGMLIVVDMLGCEQMILWYGFNYNVAWVVPNFQRYAQGDSRHWDPLRSQSFNTLIHLALDFLRWLHTYATTDYEFKDAPWQQC
jgi:hypothetical protein